MSETPSKDDELAGTEQPFVQHLVELRDRMMARKQELMAQAETAGLPPAELRVVSLAQ